VKIDFDGDYKSSINPNLSTILGNMGLTGLPAGTGGRTENGSLSLHLPEMWEISGYNRVAPQWAIHYSMAYTSWSQFQELKATGSNGQTLFYKDESLKTLTVSRWVQPTTTILTGPSVPVSPLMIARFRLRPVPSPSRIRTVSG
jgi:long-chain fatty acid transport protein